MSTSGPAVRPTTWVSAGCRRGVFIDCHRKSVFNISAVGRPRWRRTESRARAVAFLIPH
jgi:hypothetical protein